ncbi:hypothetical protein E4T44_00555 [Aureobasidium sp. EXF-8845]|nr:hypothetical protein E4T44_00555 [Aureobasidium sp. EXF-8845]KAI4857969.1 hypothetical protein E4T45_00519 [Aureobasidium sp. EXF-8846]
MSCTSIGMVVNEGMLTYYPTIDTTLATTTIALWFQPFKSRFFMTGIMVLALLAFFLLWAVGNRGPWVWLPIVIAMFGVGSFQAIYVLTSLWKEEPAVSPFASADIPMIELQPVDSSDDEDQNHNER